MELDRGQCSYERRTPENTKLYQLVQRHKDSFFAKMEFEGRSYSKHIKEEFDAFLRCGIPAFGVAHIACPDCKYTKILPFSCKKRGFCPSCGARRMAETAVHLVDEVIPEVPVRQFVLSLPVPLRMWCARKRDLLAKVCTIACEEIQKTLNVLADFEYKKNKNAHAGMVVFVQRFGSAANLNVHLHILAIDGVYEEKSTGRVKFYHARSPENDDIASLISKIIKRINKHLIKYGYLEEVDGQATLTNTENIFSDDTSDIHLPAIAASVTNRIAFGANAGKPIQRLRTVDSHRMWPNEADLEHTGDACVASGGYSLHAATCVKPHQRERLEKLIRYMSRSAIAEDRLEILENDRVRIELKTRWKDGTTHIELSALEFIEKLVALIPLPRFHLTRYFGILSPHARLREAIVPKKAEDKTNDMSASNGNKTVQIETKSSNKKTKRRKKKYIHWADLLKRCFKFEVLTCIKCGQRMVIKGIYFSRPFIAALLEPLGIDPAPPELPPPKNDAPTSSIFSYDYEDV